MNYQLKITDKTNVEFPIIIKDKKGNIIYWETPKGHWFEQTHDDNGKCLTYNNSDGYWAVYTHDDNGKRLTFKNSNGHYEIKGKKVTKEEYEAFVNPITEYTMEELVAKLGHNFKIKK